jgi:hypothetical protein
MVSQKKEVRLAGTALGRSRHVCAFFNTKDEEYRVLLPFIKEGKVDPEALLKLLAERQPKPA